MKVQDRLYRDKAGDKKVLPERALLSTGDVPACRRNGHNVSYKLRGEVPKRSYRRRLEICWGHFAPRGFESHPLRQLAVNRRGVRAAEGARLESVCTLTRTEGSNPSLSANSHVQTLRELSRAGFAI